MRKDKIVRLRVDGEFKSQLQEAIRTGKAESFSDLIRKAVSEFLSKQ